MTTGRHDRGGVAADVRAARAGDRAACDRLVREHDRLLRAVCRRHRLGEQDAADVVQQTWLLCLLRLPQLQDDDRFGGWLAAICRRECLRLHRLSARCRPLSLEGLEALHQLPTARSAPDDVSDDLVLRDDLAHLAEAVADLPPRQREVVRALAAQDDACWAQVAARLGMPLGSLGPTRARALARLALDPRLALAG